MKKSNVGNSGFTLVELIVVIAILGVIAVILVPRYIQYVDKANTSVCDANLGEFEHAYKIKLAAGISQDYSNLLEDVISEQNGQLESGPTASGGSITVTFTGPCPSDGVCTIVVNGSDGKLNSATCAKHG